jgi:hypothetical protein
MPESFIGKTWRRMREEPLIPLGMGLTIAAFVGASRAMRKGDHARVNLMFRRRIQAQAFTVVMIVAGGFYMADEKAKRKRLEDMDRQKRAEDRKGKWLEELDQRDEDDRIARERVEKLLEKKKSREEDEKKKKAAVQASGEFLGSDGASFSADTAAEKTEAERADDMLGKAKSILGMGKRKD